MATYSIAEAQERLTDLIARAAEGEEVLVSARPGLAVSLQPVRRARGPMSPERLEWLRQNRVKPLTPGPTGAEIVRAMRDED